jgi:hypothetical protein
MWGSTGSRSVVKSETGKESRVFGETASAVAVGWGVRNFFIPFIDTPNQRHTINYVSGKNLTPLLESECISRSKARVKQRRGLRYRKFLETLNKLRDINTIQRCVKTSTLQINRIIPNAGAAPNKTFGEDRETIRDG